MPADASIYGQIRPFTMEDPLTMTGKALQIKTMQQQVQEGQRKFQMEDDLASALTASGGDLAKASQMLAQRGRGTAALQLSDKATAQKRADVEAEGKRIEIENKATAAHRDALAGVNDPQSAAQWVMSGYQDPTLAQIFKRFGVTPEQALARIPQDPQAFMQWKQQAALGATKYIEQNKPHITTQNLGGTERLVSTPGLGGTPTTLSETTRTAAPAQPTELARLQAERNALPIGDPRRAQYDRVIANYNAGKGTNLTVNTGPMEPGKGAATKVDEALLDTSNRLMRLSQIETLYRPEFQELGTKITNKYASLKAMAGMNITNKERKDLEDFSAYRRNALENLNEYIRSVTGAVVNETEVPRLMGAMPNPGQGLFDGDDPVTFEAKKNDIIKMLRMGEARLAYIKRRGMSLEDGRGAPIVPLGNMPLLINERGREIEAQLKRANPQVEQKALERAVRRQLGSEFGLVTD